MKNKIKYAILFIIILIIGIISINLYQPNKEQPLKGKIEVLAYDGTYDYLTKSAEKFMNLNPKTTVEIKKIYSRNEIPEEIDDKKNKVTYIAQMNRSDFDILDFEKENYLEGQQDILILILRILLNIE